MVVWLPTPCGSRAAAHPAPGPCRARPAPALALRRVAPSCQAACAAACLPAPTTWPARNPAPRPADECWGYVDGEGVLWFNAARDSALLPRPSASGSSAAASLAAAQQANKGGRQFDRQRAEAWFLVACHLLAHHWGTQHGHSFEQRCGRVTMCFHARLTAAFPRRAAA